MKTLYITDLDGTFLDRQGKVTENSASLINKMIDDGLLFSVATARSRVSANKILKSLNLNIPVVLMNGVFIFDPINEKYLSVSPISEKSAGEVIEVFKKHTQMPFMFTYTANEISIEYTTLSTEAQKCFYEERKNNYKHFTRQTTLNPKGKNVVYFACLIDYNPGKAVFDEIQKMDGVSAVFYEDTYYDCWYLEVFSINSSKPNGMEFVKKYVKADRVVAFGDNLNDIAMMKAADWCCAVSNGRKEVRDLANKIIGSNNDDAVAKEIQKMFYQNPRD